MPMIRRDHSQKCRRLVSQHATIPRFKVLLQEEWRESVALVEAARKQALRRA